MKTTRYKIVGYLINNGNTRPEVIYSALYEPQDFQVCLSDLIAKGWLTYVIAGNGRVDVSINFDLTETYQ